MSTKKRGSESNMKMYAKTHRDTTSKTPQHTAHKYSHELNAHIKGNRGIATSREKYVGHESNFRMSSAQTNLSTHRRIDNDFIKTNKMSTKEKDPTITTATYEARFRTQVSTLKQSGGINDKDIYGFYRGVAEAYGFDRRCMKGSKHY